MAASKKPKGEPPRRKKASGPNLPEAQRSERGQQKKLRGSAEEIEALVQLAARWGMTESEAARAVREALARG